MYVDDSRLHMFDVEDWYLGHTVEVYEGSSLLGTIAYQFDHLRPAYYFTDTDGRESYLCWQDSERLAVYIYKRRYWSARRRMGL